MSSRTATPNTPYPSSHAKSIHTCAVAADRPAAPHVSRMVWAASGPPGELEPDDPGRRELSLEHRQHDRSDDHDRARDLGGLVHGAGVESIRVTVWHAHGPTLA